MKWIYILPSAHHSLPRKATQHLKLERPIHVRDSSVNTWTILTNFSPCCVVCGIIISYVPSTRPHVHWASSSCPWRSTPKTLLCSRRRTVPWGRHYCSWEHQLMHTRILRRG